jgi:hypothetical protein
MLRGLRAHDEKAGTTYADFRNEVLVSRPTEPDDGDEVEQHCAAVFIKSSAVAPEEIRSAPLFAS